MWEPKSREGVTEMVPSLPCSQVLHAVTGLSGLTMLGLEVVSPMPRRALGANFGVFNADFFAIRAAKFLLAGILKVTAHFLQTLYPVPVLP